MVCDVRYTELPKSDYVFCYVDNDEARMAVLDQCLQSGTPLIDTGLEFYESQAGHVLVVDRELFPDGACVDCYLNLGRGAPEAGCIAAGITYSGRIIANVAAGVFVQHVHRRLKANHFFIDLNSCTAEFMFLRKRGLLDMRKAMRFFHFIFLMFSFAGEIIIERPNRVVCAMLIALSVISHLMAVLIVIAVLCYAYKRNLHTVR